MSKRLWFQALIGAAVGGVGLALALRGIDLAQLGGRFGAIRWGWVAAAIAGVLLVAAGKALRWQWLYPADLPPRPWTVHFAVLQIAHMLNLMAPIRLGEVARIGLMVQEQRPAGTTLGTIGVEKALDLTAAGLLLMVALPAALLPTWLRPAAGTGSLVVGAALLTLLLVLGAIRERLSRWLAALPAPRRDAWAGLWRTTLRLIDATLQGLGGLGRARAGAVLGLTALVWLASVATMRALLLAMDVSAGWPAALALTLAVLFSNLAPTPPALIGLVQAVARETLSLFGVPPTPALALGVLLNAVLVLPPVLLGGWATGARLVRGVARPDRAGLRRALGLAPVDPAEVRE